MVVVQFYTVQYKSTVVAILSKSRVYQRSRDSAQGSCLPRCSCRHASTRCLGNFGAVGRPLCCTSRLTTFGSMVPRKLHALEVERRIHTVSDDPVRLPVQELLDNVHPIQLQNPSISSSVCTQVLSTHRPRLDEHPEPVRLLDHLRRRKRDVALHCGIWHRRLE